MLGKLFLDIAFQFARIAYIGIVINANKAEITTEIYQNRKLIKREKREFESPNGNPSQLMVDYLQRTEKHNTYAYTATALSSINQGAIPGADPNFFKAMSIEVDKIVTLSNSDRWTVYGSIYDVEDIQKRFSTLEGIDYIFPTECVIDYLRDKMSLALMNSESEVYLLYDKTSVTLVIYNGDILTYSSHFKFDDEVEDMIESNDLGDIFGEPMNVNDINSEVVELDNISDDFNTIEDLNTFIASDDPSNMGKPEMPELSAPEEAPQFDLDKEVLETNIKRDMLLFNFIKNSLNAFYKNDHFKSGFVSNAYIFDTHGAAKGIGKFFKEELCVESQIIDIDLSESICALAVAEAAL
ncbi:MAG: hypothetical protein LBE89_00795 [Helicobacteraceae bacterium]|jgi:hypothetical protein|nr:hypothetical protein [Helicobacteraceae bacterium]